MSNEKTPGIWTDPNGEMQLVVLEDGTVVEPGDVLYFDPETNKCRVEKAPHWSSTPPTESGWYWFHSAGKEPEIARVRIRPKGHPDNLFADSPEWEAFRFGEEVVISANEILTKGQWWPIPLTPPEE